MAQDQDYLKPREADNKFTELLSIVKRAYEYHGKELLERNPGAMYVFWSNDYEVSSGKHYSRITARKYKQEAQQKNQIVFLMEDFEQDIKNKALDKDFVLSDEIIKSFEKNEVVSLDLIYDNQNIPKRIKDATACCASRSYAMTAAASNTVVTSVKGANPMTVFRQIELPIIMSKDNITNIVNISRDNQKSVPKNKVDVYNLLRDEWIKSAQELLETAKALRSNDDVKQEHYKTTLKFMALETKHSLSVIECFNNLEWIKSAQELLETAKALRSNDNVEQEHHNTTKFMDLETKHSLSVIDFNELTPPLNPDGLLLKDYNKIKELSRLNTCLETLKHNQDLIKCFIGLYPKDNQKKVQNALEVFKINNNVEKFISSNQWSIKKDPDHNLEETLSNIKSFLKFEDITKGRNQLSTLKNLKLLSKAKSGKGIYW